MRLKFLEFVDTQKNAGHLTLFPSLPKGAYDRLTGKWSNWFSTYIRTVVGITDQRKVFHSFRHAFKTDSLMLNNSHKIMIDFGVTT
jgi:integrase